MIKLTNYEFSQYMKTEKDCKTGLRPCPFCVGTASVWNKGIDKEDKVYWGQCDLCGLSTKWSRYEDTAIYRWNNRPSEKILVDIIKSLMERENEND